MADSEDLHGDFKFYQYDPSIAAGAIFAVLFGISTALHFYQLIRNRTWYFIPFLIGGFFELVGYIARVISGREQSGEWTLGPYIMQSLLLLLAPALFAASIYMVLGRIIRLTDGESHSIIRANWLTKIFVGGDVLSFLAQSSGGGMLAKADSADDVKLGENIIIAGLVIQVLFFGFFIVVAGFFHLRTRKFPSIHSRAVDVPWEQHLFVLYAASAFIMVRSVFRVIEYILGNDGVFLRYEVFLYVFDAVLMFVVMALFNFWHPSKSISRKGHMRGLESQDSSLPLEDQKIHVSPKH